jgi:hypothetical protein
VPLILQSLLFCYSFALYLFLSIIERTDPSFSSAALYPLKIPPWQFFKNCRFLLTDLIFVLSALCFVPKKGFKKSRCPSLRFLFRFFDRPSARLICGFIRHLGSLSLMHVLGMLVGCFFLTALCFVERSKKVKQFFAVSILTIFVPFFRSPTHSIDWWLGLPLGLSVLVA